MRIKNENDTLRYENDNENEGDGESENYATNNSKIRLIRDKQIRDYEKRNSTLGYTDLAQHIISNCYRTGCYQLHAWAIVLRTTTDNGQQTTDNLSLRREQSQTCLSYAKTMVQIVEDNGPIRMASAKRRL